ncbi:MAG TPA: type II toxin-antitoxin system VapC family toxin [Blastocatellia bacterium]|nr:type II toxin-antitoxin system VapC family toxin [Blastocatellia bacterium]
MSYAIDTNILARSIEEAHPMHQIASEAVETLVSSEELVCIFPQVLYEFWVIATRPREQNGLGMSAAEAELQCVTFERIFTMMPDVPSIYAEWKSLVSQHEVMGKKAHDARIVAAMKVHNVSHLLTFNSDDFKRFQGIITVTEPADLVQPLQPPA